MATAKQRVSSGRVFVNSYRLAHGKLHQKPWHRGTPDEHTPLLDAMVNKLKTTGFNNIQEFFDANKVTITAEYSKMYIRSGECNHCGKCCAGCGYHKDDRCIIYEERPQHCKEYPTGKHFENEMKDECGYIFTRTEYMPELDLEWE